METISKEVVTEGQAMSIGVKRDYDPHAFMKKITSQTRHCYRCKKDVPVSDVVLIGDVYRCKLDCAIWYEGNNIIHHSLITDLSEPQVFMDANDTKKNVYVSTITTQNSSFQRALTGREIYIISKRLDKPWSLNYEKYSGDKEEEHNKSLSYYMDNMNKMRYIPNKSVPYITKIISKNSEPEPYIGILKNKVCTIQVYFFNGLENTFDIEYSDLMRKLGGTHLSITNLPLYFGGVEAKILGTNDIVIWGGDIRKFQYTDFKLLERFDPSDQDYIKISFKVGDFTYESTVKIKTVYEIVTGEPYNDAAFFYVEAKEQYQSPNKVSSKTLEDTSVSDKESLEKISKFFDISSDKIIKTVKPHNLIETFNPDDVIEIFEESSCVIPAVYPPPVNCRVLTKDGKWRKKTFDEETFRKISDRIRKIDRSGNFPGEAIFDGVEKVIADPNSDGCLYQCRFLHSGITYIVNIDYFEVQKLYNLFPETKLKNTFNDCKV